MTPTDIFHHRPDILQNQEMYEGLMQIQLLLAHHKAGEKNLDPVARKFPVDPAIIEEIVTESFRSPTEEELDILCASGAQFMFQNQKAGKTMRHSFKGWKNVVRTRLTKAVLYCFPTPAQWLSIATAGITLIPSMDLSE